MAGFMSAGHCTGATIDNTCVYYGKIFQHTPAGKNYIASASLGYSKNVFLSVTIRIGNPHAALPSSGTLKIMCGSTVLLQTPYYRPNSSQYGGFGQWTYKFLDSWISGNTISVYIQNNSDDDELYVTAYGLGKNE